MKKTILVLSLIPLSVASLYAGSFDLGLSYAAGITETKGVNTSFKLKGGGFDFGVEFNYAKQDGETSQDNLGLGIGYNGKFSEKWSYWILNLSKYDRIQKINVENALGGGPKYTLVETPGETVLSVSAGVLRHYIAYENGGSRTLTRLFGGLTAGIPITSSLRFGLINSYEPNAADFRDYMVKTLASLDQSITEKVSLKLKANNSYRSVTRAANYNDFTSTLALSVAF